MSGERKRLGRWGEALTAEHLRREGYTILTTGYRCRMGEIDLIARQGKVIAFVEVKTRSSQRYGQGREAVDARKQARLLAAARHYLTEHPAEVLRRQGLAPAAQPLPLPAHSFFRKVLR